MGTLHDIVIKKNHELLGITTNPTLEVFDLDLCDQLDNLAQTDGFVKDRVEKTVNELKLAGGVDYNDHYRMAYDNYNEAGLSPPEAKWFQDKKYTRNQDIYTRF